MNRMNPLFLKAFLTPSKNHANHCKTMLYNLNKIAVKSQTAILYSLHNERHDMNMKTTLDQLAREIPQNLVGLLFDLADEVKAKEPKLATDSEVLLSVSVELQNLVDSITERDAWEDHTGDMKAPTRTDFEIFELREILSDLGYRG